MGIFNGRVLLPAPLRCPPTMTPRSPTERRPPLPEWPHRPLLSLHLCQCRLCLGQPEGHVHGAVHLDGGGQGGANLLPLAGCRIQRAEATVAVGLERAHPEILGQGDSLVVIGSSLV